MINQTGSSLYPLHTPSKYLFHHRYQPNHLSLKFHSILEPSQLLIDPKRVLVRSSRSRNHQSHNRGTTSNTIPITSIDITSSSNNPMHRGVVSVLSIHSRSHAGMPVGYRPYSCFNAPKDKNKAKRHLLSVAH